MNFCRKLADKFQRKIELLKPLFAKNNLQISFKPGWYILETSIGKPYRFCSVGFVLSVLEAIKAENPILSKTHKKSSVFGYIFAIISLEPQN